MSNWVEMRGLIADIPGIDQFAGQIQAQRDYLMKMLYSMVRRLQTWPVVSK